MKETIVHKAIRLFELMCVQLPWNLELNNPKEASACQYGKLRHLMAVRFLLAHKGVMCQEIPVKKAYELMCAGMKEAAL